MTTEETEARITRIEKHLGIDVEPPKAKTRGTKMRYRTKVVEIEAEQSHGQVIEGVCYCKPRPHVHTLEGVMFVSDGDYVVTGLKGEKYPVKPDIFAMKYEKVEESTNGTKPDPEPPKTRGEADVEDIPENKAKEANAQLATIKKKPHNGKMFQDDDVDYLMALAVTMGGGLGAIAPQWFRDQAKLVRGTLDHIADLNRELATAEQRRDAEWRKGLNATVGLTPENCGEMLANRIKNAECVAEQRGREMQRARDVRELHARGFGSAAVIIQSQPIG